MYSEYVSTSRSGSAMPAPHRVQWINTWCTPVGPASSITSDQQSCQSTESAAIDSDYPRSSRHSSRSNRFDNSVRCRVSREAWLPTTVPSALAGLLRRRPVPGVQGTARNRAGRVERRHEVLGAAQVRGHPVRVEQPSPVHLDQGHHDPRPRIAAESGAGGQPHLHRPAAAPAAAQTHQHRIHPSAGTSPGAQGARDRVRVARRRSSPAAASSSPRKSPLHCPPG